MKIIRQAHIMLLLAVLLLTLLPCKAVYAAETYEKETLYVHNEEMNRNIYAVQITPTGRGENEKVPVVIYVHGGNGTANTYIGLAKDLSASGIAGFMFECCGGNNGRASAAKSDGAELCPSHYSSRISDLEAVLAYVKTLEYVDPERIYLWGESYGGIVVEFCAAKHNEIAGILLVSTGLSESVLGTDVKEETHLGIIEKYVPADPYQLIQAYQGPVLMICGDQDATGAYDNSQNNLRYYEQREAGTAELVTIPDGGHGYGSFTKEQKQLTQDVIHRWMEETTK